MLRIVAVTAGLLCAGSLQAATVIGAGDIANPLIEDFEDVDTGAISVSDPIFQALSITAITGAPDRNDPFNDRPKSSRGLTIGGNNALQIIDPGGPAETAILAEMSFSRTLTQFGVGLHDSTGVVNFTFLLMGFEVDSIGIALPSTGQPGFGDLTEIFISAAEFDTVRIAQSNGFVVDNITVSQVPVPAGLPLLLSGLAGFAWLRARRG